MKKFIPAITLITLLGLQVPMHAAWKSNGNSDSTKKNGKNGQANTPGFNQVDNRDAFIEADYLLWRPQLEDTFFTIKQTSDTSDMHFSLKQPSFDLSSGGRLGIGGYNADRWDIGLKGTYLFADATKNVHSLGTSTNTTLAQWVPSVFGQPGVKASALWKMHLYILDFAIGREYFMTKRFAVHPFIGLRGFHIDQFLRCNYTGNYLEGSTTAPTTVTLPSRFRAYQNIWGVGPRVGLDLNYYVNQNWSFLGGLSGSLLYSNYKVKEKIHGNDTNGTTTLTVSPIEIKVKDKTVLGRANLDAYFGFGWDQWYNNGNQRFAIALLFEASHWFQMNQWLDLDISTFHSGTASIRQDKRHGDLSFIGGTLHFQIDF